VPSMRTDRLTIERYCEEHDIELLLLDGLDEAFVGVITRFGMDDPVAIYDRDKIIEILVRDGSSWEEAEEHFGFNIIGAWVGDQTPFFLNTMPEPPPETELGVLDLVKGTKYCPKCRDHHPIDDFNKNAARYDGHDSWCRKSFNAYRKGKRREGKPPETGTLRLDDGAATLDEGSVFELLTYKDD